MSSLPGSWALISLGEEVTFAKGKKPDLLLEESKEGLLPYVDIQAFEKGIIQKYAAEDEGVLAERDDSLMVWDGARSGLVGKGIKGVIGSTLMRIRPLASERTYFHYFLKSQYQFVNTNTKGTGIPHVDPAKLWQIEFPFAPLNEQIRIANKLDSVLAKVDAAQARLEKIPTLLKHFRQSVLAAATSGELTREWREANSTLSFGHEDELAIKEIVDAQHAADCKKAEKLGRRKPRHPRANKKSIGVEIAMPEIPEQWLYQRLEDITHLVSDGTHFTPKYVEEGIPFFSVKNVRPFKVSDEDIKYVSEEEYEEIDARCSSEFGDILYTKVGATYGYAAMNKLNYRHAIYVSLALIKPVKEYFLSEYAEIVMNSELVFGQARSRVSGMGVPDLHLIEIRDFKIPIPPVLEQKEIVRRVESLFALADVVEKQYLAAKQRLDRLTQSLLAKAFRGELVPQDPNDEPAAELLKLIQAERQQQTADKPKRKAGARGSQNNVDPKQTKTNTMQLRDAPENYLLELLAQLGGETHAEVLWKKSELAIDDFYAKLKQEMQTNGIVEDKNSPDPALRKLKVANR